MKKTLLYSIVLLGCFAVIAQYVLMQQNRVASVAETTLRFFSFFTILSNTLVVVYFLRKILRGEKNAENISATTAVTMYITIVGVVYQVLLRHVWSPTGLQKIVDELLHSVIPVLVLLYWILYTEKAGLSYKRIPKWLIFPALYLVYTLIRGHFSGFYPYPFVHVGQLGMQQVLINSLGLMLVFVGVSALFVSIAGWIQKRKQS